MRDVLHNAAAALIAFGPWGVFALAIIDSIGIPLPAAIDVLLLGVAASSTHAPQTAYYTALLAIVGSLGGNVALFWGAGHGGRLFSKNDAPPGKRQRFREWFERYGLLSVFIPAVVPLAPLPLKVFVISAGVCRVPFSRFLLVVAVARTIRYFGLAYLGLQLGMDARGYLQRNGWSIIGGA